MAYSKYIGYGGTATLIGLIAWFVVSSHFATELEGDKFCDGTYNNICEWHYNTTLITIPVYYFQNKNGTQLDFIPDVKQVWHCKIDGRYTASWREDRELAPCGVGWREFDWNTPLTEKYNYIEKFTKNKKHEYKIVVLKFNPTDTVKFGGKITGNEFDPLLLPRVLVLKNCITATSPETRGIKEKYYHLLNNTFCADEPKNLSCTELNNYENITREKTAGTFIYYANTTFCADYGYNLSGKIIDYSKVNGKCTRNGCVIECDYFQGGNKNGICESGENCYKHDFCNKTEYSRLDTRSMGRIRIE